MGQNLHFVKVVAHKVEHACENKVLVFLFMFHDCFYACACQVHDCDLFVFICKPNFILPRCLNFLKRHCTMLHHIVCGITISCTIFNNVGCM